MRPRALWLCAVWLACAATNVFADPEARFREANELARAGDYPRALASYDEIDSSGAATAALYWNWSQVAAARGAQGEALWAALRARGLAPWDRSAARRIEALRGALGLEPAELTPEPLEGLARWSRRLQLGLLAAALLVLSVMAHIIARLAGQERPWPRRLAWTSGALGLLLTLDGAARLDGAPDGGRGSKGRAVAGRGVPERRGDGELAGG